MNGGYIQPVEGTVLLLAEALADCAKRVPKKVTLPVLSYVAVGMLGGELVSVTHDLENPFVLRHKTKDLYTFPTLKMAERFEEMFALTDKDPSGFVGINPRDAAALFQFVGGMGREGINAKFGGGKWWFDGNTPEGCWRAISMAVKV